MNKIAILLIPALALGGCGTMGRLKQIGKAPKMSEIAPVAAPEVEASVGARTEVATAEGRNPQAAPVNSPSLFRVGAGALFQDQRATRVGDILTIKVNISDKADVGNTTTRTRDGSENSGVGALLGLEKIAKRVAGVDPTSLVNTTTKSQSQGAGTVSRSETINMTIAALVTAVLPNGNLVIRGRQETRVNYELRELIVTGIVRPQDIARDNSIQHSQIAEARISYGGRGQLTDAQQARWGQQLLDVLSPF
jgi:flagellar L-ring protein precursor FlgH